ncbi:MAG: hypothetical protein NTX26_00185 [Candidatus Parcubacteria bacterium]|nr:hypothetical protein [Candidatus Parcubacteria bacterium]
MIKISLKKVGKESLAVTGVLILAIVNSCLVYMLGYKFGVTNFIVEKKAISTNYRPETVVYYPYFS